MSEQNTGKIFGFLTLKTLIIICVVVVAVVVAGVVVAMSSGGSSNGGGGGGGSFDYDQSYIDKNLPDSYRLAYSVTVYGNGEVSSVALEQIRTPKGYYIGSGDGDGVLYIKNGKSYDMYSLGSDGVYVNSGVTFEQSHIDSSSALFLGYMSYHATFKNSMTPAGSETVAGRDCAKYSFAYAHPSYGSVQYVFSVDKATGVCLKWSGDVKAYGEEGGFEFVCTHFSTNGVSLPAYK